MLGRRPRVCSHPPFKQTYGPESCELAASAGLIADPWQADAMDIMLAVTPLGMWVCPECGMVIPRQNGKGSIFEIRALAGLYLLGERLIMWSAHEYKTAMEGFRRMQGLIDYSDDLRKRVYKISNTNGDEGIELHGEGRNRITGRQRLRFIARSKGSGRGFSAPCNMLDEWFAGTPEQVAALLPTMSAQANPQVIYASSPPLDAITGEPLFSLKDRGEAGDPGLGWMDWGAPADVDMDDEREWARSNPAYEIRIARSAVAMERRAMKPENFGRERLGVWPERLANSLISTSQWNALLDELSRRDGHIAIALDVTPSRDAGALTIYGLRDDGLGHAELIAHNPGTEWIVPRLVELRGRHKLVGVGLDSAGPAASLLPDLKKAGFKTPADAEKPRYGELVVLGTREATAAAGSLVDAVRNQTFRHIGQQSLTAAATGVVKRPVGDAYCFARRAPRVDISPLVSLSIARWLFETRAHLVTLADQPPNIW